MGWKERNDPLRSGWWEAVLDLLPAADEPTFPAEADPVAIAAAQQEAALLGVPFCEECAKKALANALL